MREKRLQHKKNNVRTEVMVGSTLKMNRPGKLPKEQQSKQKLQTEEDSCRVETVGPKQELHLAFLPRQSR